VSGEREAYEAGMEDRRTSTHMSVRMQDTWYAKPEEWRRAYTAGWYGWYWTSVHEGGES
jgi:hypothetical protein